MGLGAQAGGDPRRGRVQVLSAPSAMLLTDSTSWAPGLRAGVGLPECPQRLSQGGIHVSRTFWGPHRTSPWGFPAQHARLAGCRGRTPRTETAPACARCPIGNVDTGLCVVSLGGQAFPFRGRSRRTCPAPLSWGTQAPGSPAEEGNPHGSSHPGEGCSGVARSGDRARSVLPLGPTRAGDDPPAPPCGHRRLRSALRAGTFQTS